MLAVDISVNGDPVRSAPVELFKNPGFAGPYDLSPDGKTFVMIRPDTGAAPRTLGFIRNWPALVTPAGQ